MDQVWKGNPHIIIVDCFQLDTDRERLAVKVPEVSRTSTWQTAWKLYIWCYRLFDGGDNVNSFHNISILEISLFTTIRLSIV